MINRARVWTVGVVLGCMSSAAVHPVFAQTQPAPPAGGPPPAAAAPPPAGYAYPPAPAPGYPPPAPGQPGYPPPAAGQPGYPPGQPGYPPPAPGQYPPAPYPGPYATPYPYAPYQPPPEGPPQMVHRARKGLLIAGLITFGVSWGLAVLGTAALNDESDSNSCTTASCQDAADVLWVPIAGPILAQNADPGNGDGWPLIIMWSLAQAAGATMTIIGMIGHDVLVDSRGRRVSSNWQVLPTMTANSQGLMLRATF